MALAHAAGPTDTPLLEQTIGQNLAQTVARDPDNEALVVRHQGVRYTYAQFADAVDEVARVLGKRPNTVKSQLRVALERLRSSYGQINRRDGDAA